MPERRKEYSDDGPDIPPIDRNLYPYPTTDSLVYAVTFGSCVYATNDVGYAAWQRSRRALHAKTTKDSGKRESYDNGMVRDVQTGKPRFDLLMPNGVPYPDQLLTRFAELMARGAEKYGERNWELARGDAAFHRAMGSAFRHFLQWYCGEDDEDHAAAVLFNITMAETLRYRADHESL